MSTNPLIRSLLILALVLTSASCATYSDKMKDAQYYMIQGHPVEAIEHVESALEVAAPTALPQNLDDSRILLLMERATLLQALGNYPLSARDFAIADERLEFLDIDAFDRFELARWVYSDDSYPYRAPAFERLTLNIINLINFLSEHNLPSARVEARRFILINDFFLEQGRDIIQKDLIALGYYLVGFTFEQSNEFSSALRFYSEAYHFGFQDPDLINRIVNLFRVSPQSVPHIDNPDLLNAASAAKSLGQLSPQDYIAQDRPGDLIIITQTGLVPYKEAAHIPIGAAATIASVAASQFLLSQPQTLQLSSLQTSGLLSTVNIPQLSTDHVPINPLFTLWIDTTQPSPVHHVNLAHQVETAWNRLLPSVAAAALTRSLVRALAANAVALGTKAAGGKESVGTLAGAILQLGLTLADHPDTRAWSLLPSDINLYRVRLTPEQHSVAIHLQSGKEVRNVDASKPFNIVNFSRFRQ